MIDLRPAAQRMAGLLEHVSEQDFDRPTPCPEARLGDLVDHVGTLTKGSIAVARKEPAGTPVAPLAANLEAGWRERIIRDLDGLSTAWQDKAAWEGMTVAGGVELRGEVAGLGALDELVVHGWDIAVATGEPYDPPLPEVEAAASFVTSFDAPVTATCSGRSFLSPTALPRSTVCSAAPDATPTGSPRPHATAAADRVREEGMTPSFPGESAAYRAARARLLEQETELRRLTESVATSRRALPPGGVVPENYVFDGEGPDGTTTPVTLTDLFAPEKDTLFIYNMMFPRSPDEDLPCPSCTQFLDAFDGVAEHAAQRINVAIVVKATLPRVLAHAQRRGWRRMRFLSSANNTYNRDYHGESDDGTEQLPMLNVFHRDDDTIRHFWGSELLFEPPDPGQDPRHGETIDPLWNLFDFTPEGRGNDWYPDLGYP